MARHDREDEPGSWHHVVNRGIARRPLFEDAADVRFFLSRLAREVRRGRLEVHAFCVLTTHFHLLVRSPRGELSEAMRRAQNEYSRTFNRRHRRDGTLIRGRFLSKPVTSLEYRSNLLRYIDGNSIQAGLAKSPWDYPWGSAAHYVHSRGPAWLERTWVEEQVRSAAGAEAFRAEDYAAVARPALAEGARRLVEERLRGARTGPDDLDDLVNAAPAKVRAWLMRKADVADGAAVGIAVCDQASIRAAVEEGRAGGGWELRPGRRRRDGWTLAETGLLRRLAGLSLQRIATTTSISVSGVARRLAAHAKLLEGNAEYRERVGQLGARALSLCHGPGRTAKAANNGATPY